MAQSPPPKRRRPREFGKLRQTTSGRWQASYTGPDGERYNAKREDGGPMTFRTKTEGETYLAQVRYEISKGTWKAPARRNAPGDAVTPAAGLPRDFDGFGEWFLANHRTPEGNPMTRRTRVHYESLLRLHLRPYFGPMQLAAITDAEVQLWYDTWQITPKSDRHDGKTTRAQAYRLLKTIMKSARAYKLIPANPCEVPGAGREKRVNTTPPAEMDELVAIVALMPPRLRAWVLIAALCGLRYEELADLRRQDIDLDARLIWVRRVWDGKESKKPKTRAGERSVPIPESLAADVKHHLDNFTAASPDALIFPPSRAGAQRINHSTVRKHWLKATATVRPDMVPHGLRHTAGTNFALSGASIPEIQEFLGHSTSSAAQRYLHKARGRSREIADRMGEAYAAAAAAKVKT